VQTLLNKGTTQIKSNLDKAEKTSPRPEVDLLSVIAAVALAAGIDPRQESHARTTTTLVTTRSTHNSATTPTPSQPCTRCGHSSNPSPYLTTFPEAIFLLLLVGAFVTVQFDFPALKASPYLARLAWLLSPRCMWFVGMFVLEGVIGFNRPWRRVFGSVLWLGVCVAFVGVNE
jgi:hypothetical protein